VIFVIGNSQCPMEIESDTGAGNVTLHSKIHLLKCINTVL
jgi:hypothetical protein